MRPQSVPSRWLRAYRWQGFAWVVLAVTLLATLALWHLSENEFTRSYADQFSYVADRQRDLLIERIHHYERVAQGGAGLFAASGAVTRNEWRRYVEHVALDSTLPGVLGTGFALAIPARERAAHAAAVRAEGFPDYTIWPAGERDDYVVVVYIEPFAGRNLRAFGFDMFSEPVRREAMDRARDTGQTAWSGIVTLVPEAGVEVQRGFLIYVPVYRNGMPTATTAERRAALHGFTFSPFRARDLMHSMFLDPRRDVEVEIYDGLPASGSRIFASDDNQWPARHSIEQDIVVGGREWRVHFHSSKAFEDRTYSWQPAIILYGGLLMSLLLSAAIYNDARHTRRLEEQVRERTRELERTRDQAESASRAKSAFLGTVSHELRTPLNAIIGFSSILLDEPSVVMPDEQRKQLEIVNRSGQQLLELIKDILDTTSIEAGQVAVHLEAVDLRGILEEQVELMQVLAAERGLELRLEPAAEAVEVLADVVRLHQVVRNLVGNAIKFTDRGAVTLRQSIMGDMARIEVEDTGIGIQHGEQNSLFENFQRLADRDGRLRPGTGLGLAISRRLVEAMDGEIGFVSEPGHGSCFWFTLPIVRRAARPAAALRG